MTGYAGWRSVAGLAMVLVLAAVLRLPALDRGFFHWDEAQHLAAVQPGVIELRKTLGIDGWPRLFSEQPPFDAEKVSYWAFSTKPGYDVIVLLYGTFAGLTPRSVAVLSLLFGLGTVVFLYSLTRRAFDDGTALVAAIILSVSTYHVFYSSSQMAVVMATFFLLLGIHFYLDGIATHSRRRMGLAGATFGYAYGCHYNLMLFVLAAFGFQAMRAIQTRKSGETLDLLTMSGTFLGVIAGFEVFYRWLIPFAYSHLSLTRGAYLAQLRYTMGFFQWVLPSGIERFPSLMRDSEGLLVVVLAVAGGVMSSMMALRNPNVAVLWLLPALQGAAALYAGLGGSALFSRMIVTMLPFSALWAAVGIARIGQAAGAVARRPYAQPGVMAAFVAAVLFLQTPRAWAVAHYRSGYPEAAAYVRANGGQEVALGMPVEQYYLQSSSGVLGLPTSMAELQALRDRTGVRLLVLDYRVNVIDEWGEPDMGPAMRELERQYRPEKVIANAMAATPLAAAEIAMTRESLARTLNDPLTPTIRIYDLSRMPLRQ